jgi:hypothetical protein
MAMRLFVSTALLVCASVGMAQQMSRSEGRDAIVTAQSRTVTSTMEYDVDRAGADYANFDLPTASWSYCRDQCLKDVKCLGWTYVKPETSQGPRPRCWLKNAVTHPNPNTCCISGVKSAN